MYWTASILFSFKDVLALAFTTHSQKIMSNHVPIRILNLIGLNEWRLFIHICVMNRFDYLEQAKRIPQCQRMTICPCCNLLKNVYSFIDPVHFTQNTICNDCYSQYARKGTSLTRKWYVDVVYPDDSMSNSKRRKISSNLRKDLVSRSLSVIPNSVWNVVSIQKSQKLKNVFTAKLVHHRLYRSDISSSPVHQ